MRKHQNIARRSTHRGTFAAIAVFLATASLPAGLLAEIAAAEPPAAKSGAHVARGPVAPLVDRLLAVQPDAVGNREAAKAWAELVRLDADRLPEILEALDRAGPLSANWVRTAVDAIAERALRAGRPLPTAALERFVGDRGHAPRGRRLAYEWLLQADPTASRRLLPAMLDDPSVELRRDAVAAKIAEASPAETQAKNEPAAKARAIAMLRQAFAAARDRDQIDMLAAKLRTLGQPVDIARQLGCVLRWKLIGPFDNVQDRGCDRVSPPEREIRFDAVYPGKKGDVRWVDYAGTPPYGQIDFNKAFGEQKGVLGYAHTVFVSAKPQRVEMRMQTGNAVKLWVNGRQVGKFHAYHSGVQPDQYVVPVELRAGENNVLLKVCQNEEVKDWTHEWGFQLRVCDRAGGAILSAERNAPRAARSTGVPLLACIQCLVNTACVSELPWECCFCEAVAHTEANTPLANASSLNAPPANAPPENAPPENGSPVNASSAGGSDWRQFRGTDSTGSSPEPLAAARLAQKESLAWKAPLPGRGPAGPIVVGGKVVVTAAGGPRQDRLYVIAIESATGKTAWQRQLWATGATICDPFGGVAASTPAADGRRIVALFSSNDVACFDNDGNLLWLRGLGYDSPSSRNDVGMASSPLIAGDVLIVQLESHGDSFVCGLDMATGRTRWKLPRESAPSWTSPTLLPRKAPAGPLVIVQSRGRVDTIEPTTGRMVWTWEAPVSTISSPAVAGGLALVAVRGLTALATDPVTLKVRIAWEQSRLGCDNVSPVVAGGRVYTVKSGGVLVCADVANGNVLSQTRLQGPLWASPVVAGGHLIAVSHRGVVQVVCLSDPVRVVATTTIDDAILATPAVSGGAVYFRSNTHLWKFQPSP